MFRVFKTKILKAIVINLAKKESCNFLYLSKKTLQCGLTLKEYEINPEIGTGKIISYSFNGLVIKEIDIKFNKKTTIKSIKNTNSLLFSSLIKGEKKIYIPQYSIEVIQENHENIISFVNNIKRDVTYPKLKTIKEISIKMSPEFIKKHQLDTLHPIYSRYALKEIKNNITCQITTNTQAIIFEIISDKRQGLLKRLFLEAKVLEIMALQIAIKDKIKFRKNTNIKKLSLAKNIITQNLNTQYSISEISKKIFLNESIFKNEFKRTFGESFFKYSLNLRMKEAKKLLAYTSIPIGEISELIGYKNPTHFTAAFKKKESLTPKQYRNK